MPWTTGSWAKSLPSLVYNHADAVDNPWAWAGVHAVMVLGQCAALLVFWRGIEREQARSEVILDSAAEGILGLNDDGTVQFSNSAASVILGRPHGNLVHKPVAHAIPDAAGALTTNVSPRESDLRRPDGSHVPILWAAKRTRDGGAGVAWVVSLHDITERKQQERARLQQLSEQNVFKTQLLNTASHELNTPISVLRMQLDLLRIEVTDPTPEARRAMDVLERNLGRLSGLVQQTLDVARIQAGRLELERATLRLGAVVAECVVSFEGVAEAKGIGLVRDNDLDATVWGDASRLSQVTYNLLANAIKFTPPGGTVTLRSRMEGLEAFVEVQDTGAGLAPGESQGLFQPFSQTQTGRAAGGSGLGLYIARTIVETHGGRLEVESAGLGRGCTFRIRLPAMHARTTDSGVVSMTAAGQPPGPGAANQGESPLVRTA